MSERGMDYSDLVVEMEKGVSLVSINRPDKGNALSDRVVGELFDFFSKKPSDTGVRVAILRGVGEKFFCAGSDIGDMMRKDVPEQSEGFRELSLLYETIRQSPIISIAAVQGIAIGGGLGLIASCDMAVAADSARFGLPEINIGIAPMIVVLPVMRVIGIRRTFLLASRGHLVTSDEALQMGLISAVVEKDQVEDEARRIAFELTQKSAVALNILKQGIQGVEEFNYARAYEHLKLLITVNMTSQDAKEGLRAFKEKRKPEWTHQ